MRIGTLVASILVLGATAPAAWASTEQLVGTLEILWGDPMLAELDPPIQRVQLRHETGDVTELRIDGSQLRYLSRLVGQKVRARVERQAGDELARLRFLAPLSAGTDPGVSLFGGAVSGSQPWVSLLCKFSNIASEPENLGYFQGMYANAPGGLDHYWREQSYGTIDVVGSEAFAWVDLPHPQTHYIATPGSGSNANLTALFNDCTGAADGMVDFSNGGNPYVGINLMFNGLLDCCAWGGGRFATLDGVTKTWRTTWNPPWSFSDEGVIAHEMGHGFGLPHSNNFDDDGHPYDSRWDMMSSATGNAVLDPTYGRLGKHTLSYHKDRLDWIPPGELFEPVTDGSWIVTIDHLALASTSNYRMARLTPSGGSFYYTVEVRKRQGNYDGNLPGDAVIIAQVDSGRSEPAWVVDGDVPPANTNNNEGSMWKVGESWSDPTDSVHVEVQSETTDGFVVRLTLGSQTLIFEDGFESGDTGLWD